MIKPHTEAANLAGLIRLFWKCWWMFWQQSKTQETLRLFPTADEDKTLFEPNYPISILICHSLGLSGATISHHHSSTWQHIWLALSGAGPIRRAWWSQRKGWEGRWDRGDVLCMGKNHTLEGQLRPQSERDRLTQSDPSHTRSLHSTSPQVLWDCGQPALFHDPGHRSSTIG